MRSQSNRLNVAQPVRRGEARASRPSAEGWRMVKDRNEQRLRLTEEMLSLFARGVELVAEGHDSVETARSTGNLCGSGKGWSGN
jgi:hypothetical protein